MEVKTANEFKNGIQFRKYLEDLLLSLNPVLPDDEMERKNTMTALDVLTECAFPSKKIIPIISAHHLDPPRHKSNIKQPEQLSHIQLEYMTRQPTRPCRVDMPSNNTVVCSGDDSLAILLKDLSLSDDDFDIDYDKINFNDKISFNVNWDEVLNEMSLSSGDSQMTNKTEESDIPANLYPNKPTQTAILNSVACNTELLQSTTFKDTVFVPANCMTPNIFGNVSTINLFTPDDADTTFVTSNIHNPFPTIPDDLLTPCILTKHHEGVQPKTPEPKKRKRVIKKPVQRRALYTEVDLSSSSSNSSWPTNAAENITPTESQQNIKKCRNVKTVHQKEMMLGNIFPFRYDFWPRVSKNKKQVKKTKPVPTYERRLGSIFPFKKSLFSSFTSVNKQLQKAVIPYTNPVTCRSNRQSLNSIRIPAVFIEEFFNQMLPLYKTPQLRDNALTEFANILFDCYTSLEQNHEPISDTRITQIYNSPKTLFLTYPHSFIPELCYQSYIYLLNPLLVNREWVEMFSVIAGEHMYNNAYDVKRTPNTSLLLKCAFDNDRLVKKDSPRRNVQKGWKKFLHKSNINTSQRYKYLLM
ncbi:hypothetical protein V9T40_009509 [Parthenolecanium corni]|uniref:Uncharacterized protein n=1 Tax=Parthenolecanium corni TaxID=536013 RepID=A0AAN9TQ46_9HEMI